MLGYHKHTVSVVGPDVNYENYKPMVLVVNNGDGYYWQGFETREEVDLFIRSLIDARDLAFPGTP